MITINKMGKSVYSTLVCLLKMQYSFQIGFLTIRCKGFLTIRCMAVIFQILFFVSLSPGSKIYWYNIFFKKRKHFKDTQFCRYLFLRVQIFANAEGQNYIAGSMVDTGRLPREEGENGTQRSSLTSFKHFDWGRGDTRNDFSYYGEGGLWSHVFYCIPFGVAY